MSHSFDISRASLSFTRH